MGKSNSKERKNINMKKKDLKTMSLCQLLDIWEATSTAERNPNLSTVRGWIMDEIERRNPEAFNHWLDEPAPKDEDLRKYVLNAGK
jgi:hypothetical protein